MVKMFAPTHPAWSRQAESRAQPPFTLLPCEPGLACVDFSPDVDAADDRLDLDVVLESFDLALIVLNQEFEIVRMRGPVEAWVRMFFSCCADRRKLPFALENWARQACLASSGEVAPTRPEPALAQCFEASDRQLWVQLSSGRRPGERHLLMRQQARPASRRSLERLGLTAREAEVLCWLARGKSNPEIARILGIAPRTVHKHLEHVYAQLGVENRTAAVARALEHA